MHPKSLQSLFSFIKESKKYIWIFLFSQLFPAFFYVMNNGKKQSLFSWDFSIPSIVVDALKFVLASLIFVIIFIIIGYITKLLWKKGYKKVLITLIILNFIGNGIEFFIYLNLGSPIT